jgi:3-dehydroquinate dehydratase
MTQINEKDVESQLIQKMSEMCEKIDNKGFFGKLIESAPSIFITLCGIAIGFYVYVQIELSNLQTRETFRELKISEMNKMLIDVKSDLQSIERKILNIEYSLRTNPPTPTTPIR